jgi:hypothetical protein
MNNALKSFPWFEMILIVGLAIALIVKPQTTVLSATSSSTASTTTTATTATATPASR